MNRIEYWKVSQTLTFNLNLWFFVNNLIFPLVLLKSFSELTMENQDNQSEAGKIENI